MPDLSRQSRLAALLQLGRHLRAAADDAYLQAVMQRTAIHNPWFTLDNQALAVSAAADQFLAEDKLIPWAAEYPEPDELQPRRVGLVLAGNIPLVGFHDLLCVFISGHRAVVKLSEKSPYLIPYLVKLLERFQPGAGGYFEFAEKLGRFDAVIATGSNNSARYFEQYFGKYPHIIRRNRNGAAVLTGEETTGELAALAVDIFRYFGLGCRNVSKIYVPAGYDFHPLLEATHVHNRIQLHPKYKNNFDYNYALMLLNKEPFHSNGAVIIREGATLQSPIATLHYETYTEIEALETELAGRRDELQLVTARPGLLRFPTIPFGEAQQPGLSDYADGVDTMRWLVGLG
ncbi:MAG: acyl-CoA reductase [Saprospiraceae bacterium]